MVGVASNATSSARRRHSAPGNSLLFGGGVSAASTSEYVMRFTQQLPTAAAAAAAAAAVASQDSSKAGVGTSGAADNSHWASVFACMLEGRAILVAQQKEAAVGADAAAGEAAASSLAGEKQGENGSGGSDVMQVDGGGEDGDALTLTPKTAAPSLAVIDQPVAVVGRSAVGKSVWVYWKVSDIHPVRPFASISLLLYPMRVFFSLCVSLCLTRSPLAAPCRLLLCRTTASGIAVLLTSTTQMLWMVLFRSITMSPTWMARTNTLLCRLPRCSLFERPEVQLLYSISD
jgi:hypothetical protein